jgi:hypothetical protein
MEGPNYVVDPDPEPMNSRDIEPYSGGQNVGGLNLEMILMSNLGTSTATHDYEYE